MKSQQVRQAFVDFFVEREHRSVASSPLVLPGDPTLLFANAGMNQFKDVFTGREQRDYARATTSQKCLRVSGKHNDLEMVGRTPRHHTFFEMLGNFSFGDYFKEDAIAFAWDLLTRVYGIPAERLWVSVFGGAHGLEADTEAEKIWAERIGVDPARILRLGEKDNFWRMGDTGPCGPCSEIHIDLGEELTSVQGPSTPENDEARFLEIWNLVFMQFDQRGPGEYRPLPAPSIDTGMGLERIAAVLQDRRSNYDTDLFTPLLDAAAKRAGLRYGDDPEADFSMRVIADHSRAFCFLVADGIVPANDRRGYVLRRLLRRAIRHGRKLGMTEPFLHEVTPVITEQLGAVYPELVAARDAVLDIGLREERRFSETLSTGLTMLEEKIGQAEAASGAPTISGRDLFRLYDTFGFPLDLARDIAEERGLKLDEAGFEAEMARQRARAQASWKGGAREEVNAVYHDLASHHETRFTGYEDTCSDGSTIVALLRDGAPVGVLEEGQEGEAILDATPFYAESGGQQADRGVLVGAAGRAAVYDVQRPAGSLIVHRVRVERGALATGDVVRAEADEVRRDAIRRNHTSTHLVHAALREVVGTHVKQAGSLVAPDRLRFDFSHFAPLSPQAVEDIESLVHQRVLEDVEVQTETMDLDDALKAGAMALFGEKYGARVRVVSIGDSSQELCGGTHCERTGEIGLIKLVQEKGIASGTRRVEAVSGTGALERFREEHAIVRALEEQFSVSRDKLLPEIDRRMEQSRALQRDLEHQRVGQVRGRLMLAAESAEEVAGIRVLAERADGLNPQELRELADNLRQKLRSGVVVLGRADGSKASLLVAVTEDLKQRAPAGDLVRVLARIIGGGGGGRPDLAEAGGKDVARLDEALAAAKAAVAQRLNGE